MSEQKHTPGPWHYGHVGTEALWIGPDYNRTPVAHVDHDMEYARDNSRANARLIAAAPDLLEALNSLVALNNEHSPFGGEFYQDRLDRAWDAALAAIARATGGDHA